MNGPLVGQVKLGKLLPDNHFIGISETGQVFLGQIRSKKGDDGKKLFMIDEEDGRSILVRLNRVGVSTDSEKRVLMPMSTPQMYFDPDTVVYFYDPDQKSIL